MAISDRKIRNNCNSCSAWRIETLNISKTWHSSKILEGRYAMWHQDFRKKGLGIRIFGRKDDICIVWRRAWKSWTSIWYFPTKHCFPSGSASWIHSLVISCETANWRILSLKSHIDAWPSRHPLNEEMIAADPNIKRSRARWWWWVVFTLGFIWCWNWFSIYCIIPCRTLSTDTFSISSFDGDSRWASYLVQFVEPRRFDTITFSDKPFLSKTGYIYFADVGRRVH